VVEADATLLVTRGPATGGSALTASLAHARGRSLYHLDLSAPQPATARAAALREWLDARSVSVLNVAGPRESGCPGIARQVQALLRAALATGGPGG
jgi:hypothetical protein